MIQLLAGVAAGLAALITPGGERPLTQNPAPGSPSPSSPRPDGDPLLPLADPDQHGGGVAGLDGDLHNVSRVLRLSFVTHVRRIVLPGALPMIFTGLRLSLGWPGWC